MNKIAVTLNFRNHCSFRGFFSALAGACLLFWAVGPAASAQSKPSIPSDTLAEIGPTVITAQDLIERIELMVWPGKEIPARHDSAKIRALQSMVAEELLAREGARTGVVADSAILMQSRTTERLLVRDELYRREVRAGVTVSEKEILDGLKRFSRNISLSALTARSQNDAKRIADMFARSSDPDSVLRRIPSSLILRRDTASVTFGQLEESIETVAYGLTPSQRASAPLQTPRGDWVILYLLDSESSPAAAKTDATQRRSIVEETIRTRKEITRARTYVGKILGPQQARSTPELFDRCVRTFLDVFRSDPERYRTPKGYSLNLAVDTVSGILAGDLPRAFVLIQDGNMSLGDVLNSWMFINFFFPSLEERDFASRLNGAIREVVAAELLTRQGYREGLQHSAGVRHDLALWTRYWTAQLFRSRIMSEVTAADDEVLAVLAAEAAALGPGYEVNVREILSDSLRTSLTMFDRLLRGEDMAGLARRYSRRGDWAWRGGESGFFAVGSHPELGIAALDADSGKIVGPISLKEGYSVFTVLGKRFPQPAGSPSYDSLKSLVRLRIRAEKGQRALDGKMTALARTQNIRMYYSRLKNVSIMPSNMVTTRSIGFGGGMKAFPPLVPQWGWIEHSGDLKHLLP